MAAQTSMLHIRVDDKLKADAAEKLAGVGLTVSDAVRILLTRVVKEGALPAGLTADPEAYDAWFRAKVQEALADTRPLQAMIAAHVDASLLKRVAEAHQRGRRLYIGTTNLDAPRFVVWNMGLIASSGHPDALALFRKVMLASASIPVAFPPVLFDVELTPGGPRYDEMKRWNPAKHPGVAVAALRVDEVYSGGERLALRRR